MRTGFETGGKKIINAEPSDRTSKSRVRIPKRTATAGLILVLERSANLEDEQEDADEDDFRTLSPHSIARRSTFPPNSRLTLPATFLLIPPIFARSYLGCADPDTYQP